ncbi:MAG: hypothetical protein WAZ12_04615 [Candidatus Absconditicoccaceae bacterium]
MTDSQKDLENPSPENGSNVNKIDSIKANLTDIKNSVEDVNKKIEDLDKNKKTLAQQEIVAKQKEIEEKKLEIDKKKKETEELIKQARALADLEQDIAVTVSIRQELDKYEKQLKDINPKSSGFWEKVKEKGGKTLEWVKEHPWQTAGIGLLVVGAIALFRRRKKNKEEGKDGDKKEKEGFWNHGIGKFLKWTGIGTGAYYLIHGLQTGRWSLSDFFNRDKREKIDPKDLNERYEKEIPAELKPKYEKFGNNVDEYRKLNGNTNSLGTLEDEKGKEISIKKGTIPAAMDNAYDNVKDILDTNGDVIDKRASVGGKIWGLVTELGGKVVGGLFKPMVGVIKGLVPNMFGSDGTPNEEFKKRAETEDNTRDEQVANLMQKYSMVRSYLNDKRKQLKRKYITEQLKNNGVNNPTEKQITDYEQDDPLIEARMERDFLNKKIISADDSNSAVVTLESQNIYDSSISKETEATIEEVKKIKQEIVPDETIFERAKNSSDINKDEGLRGELTDVSKKFGDHLKEGILHRNIIEGVANCFGVLNLDELRNSKSDDLEEAIDKLGFGDEVKKFKLNNQDFYTKLQNKTLTKNDIIKFESTINDYFSLLQQVFLEKQSQQENEGSGNLGTWFMGRMRYIVSTPQGWVIMGSAFLLSKSKIARNLTKGAISISWNAITKPGKWLLRTQTRKINVPTTLSNKYLKNLSYGDGATAYKNFVEDIKKGRMNYEEAKYVFDKHQKYPEWKKGSTSYFSEFLEKELHLNTDQIKILEIHFNNKNIRKILSKNNTTLTDLIDKLKIYEDEIKKLSGDQKIFCEKLFTKAEFTKLDDIDNVIKNMDKIDITGLNAKEFNKITEVLGKDISKLKTVDEINARVIEIKKTIGNSVDITKTLTVEQKKIYDLVLTDSQELKKAISNLNLDVTSATGKFYQKQVDGLLQFEKRIMTFTDDEITAFNALRKMELKSYHIIEIFELKKITAIGNEIKKLESGAPDLSGLLKQLKSSKSAGADISESLIKTIDDIHVKSLLKSADDVVKFIKDIFKIIAKVT